jgi:hypothetical protein
MGGGNCLENSLRETACGFDSHSLRKGLLQQPSGTRSRSIRVLVQPRTAWRIAPMVGKRS